MDKETADDLTEEPKQFVNIAVTKYTNHSQIVNVIQDPNGEHWMKIDVDGDGDDDIAVANEDLERTKVSRCINE